MCNVDFRITLLHLTCRLLFIVVLMLVLFQNLLQTVVLHTNGSFIYLHRAISQRQFGLRFH